MTEGEYKFVDTLELHQSLSKHGANELRSQTVQVCFLDENFSVYLIKKAVINAEEVTTLTQFKGKNVPHAYYINYLGWGYGNFLIDDNSLEAYRQGLSKVEDDVLRELIYNTISKMVTDGRCSAKLFFDIIRNHIMDESNLNIITTMLSEKIPSFLRYYVPEENHEEEAEKMFDFLLNKFFPNAKELELKQHILQALIIVASSDEHLQLLQSWIENKKPFYIEEGEKKEVDIKINISIKHQILKKISTSIKLNNEEFQEFVKKQLAEDTKDQDLVVRCKLAIEAAT